MGENGIPKTGDIVFNGPDADGARTLVSAVAMLGEDWDRLTDWINDLYYVEGERPDIPLETRVAEFLDLQTQIWAHDARQLNGDVLAIDLDDDVPF